MPCDHIIFGVGFHNSSLTNLNNVSNSVIGNVKSPQIFDYPHHKILKSKFAPSFKFVWIPEKFRDYESQRHINMSPNPENIHFLHDIHEQQQDGEDEIDSGFVSGGNLNNRTFSCEQDHRILMTNQMEISVCGFYYPNLDSIGAMKMLKQSSSGTFLIRNSLDARFLFSLSVKTQRGATSVRIAYNDGWFSFDCDESIRKRMPRFRSVLSLVDHHVELSRQGINNSWRWEEKSGRINMVVDISKPYRRSVTSLKLLSTIALNKSFEQWQYRILQRPSEHENVMKCIRDYPFKV